MPEPKPRPDATLLGAVLAVQAELPALAKDKINPHFGSKFIGLETIVETVGPILNKHGLVWVTRPGRDEQTNPVLSYELIHAATGEAISGDMPLLLGKSDMQGLGSALTYARRYALTAVLNLVADEDDDGNAASHAHAPAREGDTISLVNVGRGLRDEAINAALSKAGMEPQAKPFGALVKVPVEKAEQLEQALELQKQMA